MRTWLEGARIGRGLALCAGVTFGVLGSSSALATTGELNLGGPGSHSSEGTEDPGKLADGITAPTGTVDFDYDGAVPAAANQGTLTLVLENTSEPGGEPCAGGTTKQPVIEQFNWNTGPDITAMSLTSALDADGNDVLSHLNFAFTNPKNLSADGFGKYNAQVATDNPWVITSNNPTSFNGSQIKSPLTLTFLVTGPEASIDDCTFTTYTTASQNCGCPTVFIAHFMRGGCNGAFSAWISDGDDEECPPPTIDCPDDIVAECTSPNGANVTFTVTAVSECDESVDIDCTSDSGDLFPFGTTEVCCTATDDEGQTATCCFDVTVVDTTPPTIDCPDDMTVECTSPDGAIVTYTTTGSDVCGDVTIDCVPASGSQFPFGTTEVCCTARDESNLTSTCCFDVTVVDTTPPTIDCPDDMTVECTSPNGAIVTYTTTGSDVCGDVTIECAPPSGSQFPFGTTQVCCVARDESNLTATCCFDVTVVDTTPPTIDCPDDITVECTGPDGAIVNYTTTGSDVCGDVTIECVPPSGSTFPIGSTEVCCTATDQSQLTATCCFDVTVHDSEPPTIDCPEDFTLECTGPDGAPGTFVVTAEDDCDPDVEIDCNFDSGSTFPFGETEVCCTATDDGGLTATCCFTITVVDTVPPEITCPEDIEVTVADIATEVEFEVTATDLCDPEPRIQCDPPSGSVFNAGCTLVVCSATDDSGNTSVCDFEVCVFPCVNFDADINGAVPEFAFITNQYQPLGVLVSGQSDVGPPGVMARRQGAPGSSTDDVNPRTDPNYIQTFSGGDDSDSGIITFDFVDPNTGTPTSACFVRLTFLDIEGSGTGAGGTGRTKLQGYDKDGNLIDTQPVPVGANGARYIAIIGEPDGPAKFAKAVVTLGNPDPGGESGGIDELCFQLNAPPLETRILGPGPEFAAGGTAPFLVFAKHNRDRTVNAELILRATAKKTKYGRVFSGPHARTLTPFFNNLSNPERFTLRIPPSKPSIWGRRIYFYAEWTDTRTDLEMADCLTSIVILPPN